MSASNTPGRREVAHRIFAAEFEDANLSYSESDEERAPNYVIVPSGARVNRMFFVGVLTETERVNEDMIRARVVDPTGAFVTYAGQYQPDELAFLERADPPAYLAVTGKARTFQPEDSDRVFTSVRPESISEVDAETRDRWIVQAAERTVERVEIAAAAIDSGLKGDALRESLENEGIDPSLAAGIPLAFDHYGTTPSYLAGLRKLAEDALGMVAGEVDEVGSFDLAPDEGAGDAASLADPDITVTAPVTDTEPSTVDDDSVGGDEIGDFEPSTGTDTNEEDLEAVDEVEATIDSSDDNEFDPAEDDALSEVERQAVEEEHGTDFSTANEVGEPESADVGEEANVGGEIHDRPDETVEGPSTEDAEAEGAERTEEEPTAHVEESGDVEAPAENAVDETDSADNDAAEADIPLEEVVMDAMREIDDGDGAERDAIVEAVSERTGASSDEISDAIQDALMSGQCYEPEDDVFKPI